MSYAGDVTPEQAWQMLADDPEALLVDCRTAAEWRFVGVPDVSALRPNGGPAGGPGSDPGSAGDSGDVVFVEWSRTDGTHNDGFLADLAAAGITPADRPVVFLCRSGNRSIGAAEAATAAGIGPSYNVLDGFEGHLDDDGHRGGSGWRAVGLPWRQS